VAIGMAAAVEGTVIRRLGLQLQPVIERRKVVLTTVAGLAIGGLAIIFAEITGKGADQVLFSGESALAPLIRQAATWSVGALVLLIVCKGLAYGVSRGGLPLTSVLLTLVLLQADAVNLISVVIVAVVVAWVASARLTRWLPQHPPTPAITSAMPSPPPASSAAPPTRVLPPPPAPRSSVGLPSPSWPPSRGTGRRGSRACLPARPGPKRARPGCPMCDPALEPSCARPLVGLAFLGRRRQRQRLRTEQDQPRALTRAR
jgi:hypothetical protein